MLLEKVGLGGAGARMGGGGQGRGRRGARQGQAWAWSCLGQAKSVGGRGWVTWGAPPHSLTPNPCPVEVWPSVLSSFSLWA